MASDVLGFDFAISSAATAFSEVKSAGVFRSEKIAKALQQF
jgi:hypothetical protein